MELHGPFPWNSMENVLILHGDIFHGNPWRNFHGNCCPNPWTMEFTGEFSIEFQEFHGGFRVNFQLPL